MVYGLYQVSWCVLRFLIRFLSVLVISGAWLIVSTLFFWPLLFVVDREAVNNAAIYVFEAKRRGKWQELPWY